MNSLLLKASDNYLKLKNKKVVLVGLDPASIEVLSSLKGEIGLDFCVVGENEHKETAFEYLRSDRPADFACDLLVKGSADIIMKGNIHSDVFFRSIIKARLLEENSLLSHIVVFKISDDSFLFLSDPSISVEPTVEKKAQIVENLIAVLRKLGYEIPKIAVLSSVEFATDAIKSSVEAKLVASLFKAREDCVVEGPLAIDTAVSREAAEKKNISGVICGDADAVVVPNLDSGNILTKGFTYISKLKCANIISGSSCPVVFTSRSAGFEERLHSVLISSWKL